MSETKGMLLLLVLVTYASCIPYGGTFNSGSNNYCEGIGLFRVIDNQHYSLACGNNNTGTHHKLIKTPADYSSGVANYRIAQQVAKFASASGDYIITTYNPSNGANADILRVLATPTGYQNPQTSSFVKQAASFVFCIRGTSFCTFITGLNSKPARNIIQYDASLPPSDISAYTDYVGVDSP